MDITQRKITKIAREVNRYTVRQLKKDGIGSGELEVVYAIRKNPGISQKEVCDITGFDKAAVARQCANLEEKGYIIRKENPEDKRCRKLYPDKKTENLHHSKANIEADLYSRILEVLNDDEKKELARLLDIVYSSTKEECQK